MRPLRLEYPGAVYHITSRGNAGRQIFADHADRQVFFEWMTFIATRFGWLYYAYCLMDNHYHLVVETPRANLSRGMSQLNSGYARHFNKRYATSGHLFQARYKGLLVQKEGYLLTVLRYTVLNPVRAGICLLPEDYPYSSYRETVGQNNSRRLIEAERTLSFFGTDAASASDSYRDFVRQGIKAESIHDQVKSRSFLGDDRFVAKHTLEIADERMSEIPSAFRPAPRPPLNNLILNPGDIDSIYYAYREWGYTMRELARHLRKHYSTVSRMIKAYEKNMSP